MGHNEHDKKRRKNTGNTGRFSTHENPGKTPDKPRTNPGKIPEKCRKNTGKSGDKKQNLTPKEAEVLRLITTEYLTPKQIQTRLNIRKSTYYEHTKSIKLKGFFNTGKIPEKNGGYFSGVDAEHKYRLHALQIRVSILWKDRRYKEKIAISNYKTIDNATINYYPDSVFITINEFFLGDTPADAVNKSNSYIRRLLSKIENDAHIELTKPRKENICIVKGQFSETNNELAQDYEVKGERFNVRTTDDGKVWLHLDNSFSWHELETSHPRTHVPDMETVKSYFNDLRDNKPLNNSQIIELLLFQQSETDRRLNETASALCSVVKLLTSQLPKPATPQAARAEDINYIG